MNNEQKKYVIKKIDKYDADIKKEEKNYTKNICLAVGYIILLICAAIYEPYLADATDEIKGIRNSLEAFGGVMTGIGLKNCIEIFIKKTGLENLKEQLITQAEMYEMTSNEEQESITKDNNVRKSL